jgi:anhydro-N-acetylmuramic acid kinase
MDYRAIGLYSGNPATGLDIVFASFREQAGKWTCEVLHTAHFSYSDEWKEKLGNAKALSAPAYCTLHAAYGAYTGELVNGFIAQYELQYQVALIASPGHLVFNDEAGNAVWAGHGANLAAATRIPVISDFYALDMALGGKQQHWTAINEKLNGEMAGAPDNPSLLYAFMGVLRWRQEYNVFAADTGAAANTIGGAFWNGDEA